MRKQNAKSTLHPNQVIKAVKLSTGEIRYFANGHECAQKIGCTHVLVYNTLNPNHWSKTAVGWKLEWTTLSKDEIKKIKTTRHFENIASKK